MTDVPVLVARLRPAATVPAYAQPGDGGAVLCAAEAVDLPPGGIARVPTGLALALPDGFAGLVVGAQDASDWAVLPVVVDAGYRDELLVPVLNVSPTTPLRFDAGQPIARLVVQTAERAKFLLADRLPGAARN